MARGWIGVTDKVGEGDSWPGKTNTHELLVIEQVSFHRVGKHTRKKNSFRKTSPFLERGAKAYSQMSCRLFWNI